MSLLLKAAYRDGESAACVSFGLKEAGAVGTLIGKGMQWAGRAAGAVPLAGQAAGAIMGGIGGGIQGLSNGEGMKGMLARGAAGAATGAMPLGTGLVAGAASDLALNKMLAPKPPTGPAVGTMSGMMNQGPVLPGYVR